MGRRSSLAAAALAAWIAAPSPLAAQPGDRAAAKAADDSGFALVVGANAGGAGQMPLRFAEADAARMAEVLRDLGGYSPDRVQVVLHPTRAGLEAALDALTARAVEAAAGGSPPRIFFYYSGHARSAALNLGAEELPLTQLRERLLGISGGLTVIVLDACQSGAFSRIKGAEPSADFSYNSLARLGATGVAVMASSSATELSQESDRLGSSYFTHHLLVGLRGAGDASGDGKVSLDEAYRYAYHRTLIATSATAVGAQHASLEVDLKGKGEVAITTPTAAAAQLELAAPLAGLLLVERRAARAVVAELYKARGAPVRLGLPAGDYRVLVRVARADHLRQCDIALPPGGRGQLASLDGCDRVPLVDEAAKGPRPWYRPRLAAELRFGGLRPVDDDFTRTLEGFGYHESLDDFDLPGVHLSLGLVGSYGPHFSVVTSVSRLASRTYQRDVESSSLVYSWDSYAWGVGARGSLPLGNRLTPYVQVGGGLAMATTSFTGTDDETADDIQWGWHLGASAGVALQLSRHVSLFAEASYVTAPVLDNLIGDTHDTGGRLFVIGGRADIYRGSGE